MNLRRHREFKKQLTTAIDATAGRVLRDILAQIGIARGLECCRCHRPLEPSERDQFHFVCSCGHCSVHLSATHYVYFQAHDRLEHHTRQFQEAA